MTRALLAALALGVLSAACASEPERSVESFCETYADEERRLFENANQRAAELDAQSDPLTALFMVTADAYSVQVDMELMLKRLSEVAPDEIRLDVEFLVEEMKRIGGSTETDIGAAFLQVFVTSARAEDASRRSTTSPSATAGGARRRPAPTQRVIEEHGHGSVTATPGAPSKEPRSTSIDCGLWRDFGSPKPRRATAWVLPLAWP